MRVLFVTPSAGLGGAERALVEAFRSLRAVQPDWSLALVAPGDGPLSVCASALGVETTVLPLPPIFAATGESGRSPVHTWLRLAAAGGSAAGYARRLRAHFRRWRPDVIHSNGIKTHLLATWAVDRGTPLVWHVHDYLSSRGVSGRLLRARASRAALVLANSRSVADDASRVLGHAVRIETIYSAIDATRFSVEGPRLDLDAASGLPPASPGTLRVGLVATFARWKGHDVFLRAMAALAPRHAVRAYVIGGPVYQTGPASQVALAGLQSLARDLGLRERVGFTGFLDDTSGALRSLDVVVHASTEPEPFGLAIAEGMACGRAVVMSDAGGAREIGEPERTCLTHAPGDVAGLERQIARLLADPALRSTLGAAAAAVVRTRFTPSAMGAALRDAYLALPRTLHDATP